MCPLNPCGKRVPVPHDDDEFRFELTEHGLLTIVRCITFLFGLLILGAIAVGVAGRLSPECPAEKQ